MRVFADYVLHSNDILRKLSSTISLSYFLSSVLDEVPHIINVRKDLGYFSRYIFYPVITIPECREGIKYIVVGCNFVSKIPPIYSLPNLYENLKNLVIEKFESSKGRVISLKSGSDLRCLSDYRRDSLPIPRYHTLILYLLRSTFPNMTFSRGVGKIILSLKDRNDLCYRSLEDVFKDIVYPGVASWLYGVENLYGIDSSDIRKDLREKSISTKDLSEELEGIRKELELFFEKNKRRKIA